MTRFVNHHDNLIGQADNFLEILEKTSHLAALNKPVLIIGERGTGKELIAARLHYLSQRWDQQYLKLNCAALNENLLETELFGYDSGAFTGATKRHEGRFERAHKGTLFLDEIANTSSLIQEKLLRIVEYGEFERVGGSKTLTTDVRLIAATNEDLPALARSGKFRADLLDRLAFDVITLPPLRARPDDIMILAESFAINMTRELEYELFSGFTQKAKHMMMEYNWPGNIRELKNVIERSVYRSNNPHLPINELIIDPFDSPYRPSQVVTSTLPVTTAISNTAPNNNPTANDMTDHDITDHDSLIDNNEISTLSSTMLKDNRPTIVNSTAADFPLSLKAMSQQYEIKLINAALTANHFNQKKTAKALQLTYHQLRGYLKKYNLLDGNITHDA